MIGTYYVYAGGKRDMMKHHCKKAKCLSCNAVLWFNYDELLELAFLSKGRGYYNAGL